MGQPTEPHRLRITTHGGRADLQTNADGGYNHIRPSPTRVHTAPLRQATRPYGHEVSGFRVSIGRLRTKAGGP